jgi:hypothetical protein
MLYYGVVAKKCMLQPIFAKLLAKGAGIPLEKAPSAGRNLKLRCRDRATFAKILEHLFAIRSNHLSAIEWPRTGVTGLWRKLYLHRTKGPVGGRHEIFRESSCRA